MIKTTGGKVNVYVCLCSDRKKDNSVCEGERRECVHVYGREAEGAEREREGGRRETERERVGEERHIERMNAREKKSEGERERGVSRMRFLSFFLLFFFFTV